MLVTLGSCRSQMWTTVLAIVLYNPLLSLAALTGKQFGVTLHLPYVTVGSFTSDSSSFFESISSFVLAQSVQCDPTQIHVFFDFDQPFNGMIYAEDFFRKPSCKVYGSSSKKVSISLPLNIDSAREPFCGVRLDKVLVLQKKFQLNQFSTEFHCLTKFFSWSQAEISKLFCVQRKELYCRCVSVVIQGGPSLLYGFWPSITGRMVNRSVNFVHF